MIYFEWKKIWLGKLTQLAIIGCAMFFIFCVFSNTAQTNAIRDDGTTVSGMDAIRVMKERNIPIELTQAETERIMNEYLDYTKNPDTGSDNAAYFYLSEDMYRTWYQPNNHHNDDCPVSGKEDLLPAFTISVIYWLLLRGQRFPVFSLCFSKRTVFQQTVYLVLIPRNSCLLNIASQVLFKYLLERHFRFIRIAVNSVDHS